MPRGAKVVSLVPMLHMRRLHGQTKSIMLEGRIPEMILDVFRTANRQTYQRIAGAQGCPE